jgi:hypothetical protein
MITKTKLVIHFIHPNLVRVKKRKETKMRTHQKFAFIVFVIISLAFIASIPAFAVEYAKPVPLNK